MIRFFESNAGLNSPLWKEMRWLWKGDRLRKKHLRQLDELRHWMSLGQCRLWLAWDDNPPKELCWMKPMRTIGMVLTMTSGDVLTIQFAAGVRLQSWMPLAVERMERLAQGRQMHVYVRLGWKQELPPAWKASSRIEVRYDPELLYVRPDIAA
jgi:hypothetical protein